MSALSPKDSTIQRNKGIDTQIGYAEKDIALLQDRMDQKKDFIQRLRSQKSTPFDRAKCDHRTLHEKPCPNCYQIFDCFCHECDLK